MSWIYKLGHSEVIVCDNREVIHWAKPGIDKPGAIDILEQENKMRRHLCPFSIELSKQEEYKDDYFEFIEQETTGLWYRTGGIIFHFEKELDAVAFRLRF